MSIFSEKLTLRRAIAFYKENFTHCESYLVYVPIYARALAFFTPENFLLFLGKNVAANQKKMHNKSAKFRRYKKNVAIDFEPRWYWKTEINVIVKFSSTREEPPRIWTRSEAKDTWNSWNGFLHGQIFIQRPHDPRIPLFIRSYICHRPSNGRPHKTFRGTFIFDRDDRDDSTASWRRSRIHIEC